MKCPKSSFIFSCFLIFLCGIIVSDEPIKTIWSLSTFGKDDFFYEPSDIEVDLHGSLIYVADSRNNRVLEFDFLGRFLKIIGREGQGPAEFSNPTGLFILEDGRLAVADVGNSRIQIFDKDGNFVQSIIPKGVRVADMIFHENTIYAISTFGSSGYSLDMRSEKDTQPLLNMLDNQGNLLQSISVDDYPETHPFLRAIKHRVCLAMSKDGQLYVPHFAMNVVHIFDPAGKKIAEFHRPLPFKPGVPRIIKQISNKDGAVQMQANFDFVTQEAKMAPDGSLYLLTFTESYLDRAKRKNRKMDPSPLSERIDVIDAKSQEVIRYIAIDAGAKAFALMNGNHMVYVYEDSEGKTILKCIQY